MSAGEPRIEPGYRPIMPSQRWEVSPPSFPEFFQVGEDATIAISRILYAAWQGIPKERTLTVHLEGGGVFSLVTEMADRLWAELRRRSEPFPAFAVRYPDPAEKVLDPSLYRLARDNPRANGPVDAPVVREGQS